MMDADRQDEKETIEDLDAEEKAEDVKGGAVPGPPTHYDCTPSIKTTKPSLETHDTTLTT